MNNQIWKSNSFGQRHRVGSVSLWKKFEYRATGIGCASAIVCVLISLYYNVILSWALYYLYNSFRGKCQIPTKIGFNRFLAELPWSSCPVGENGTQIEECSTTSATEYFYYRETLDFAGWGDSDSVKIVWPILLCNTVLWAVIFFACVKGISSAGKAMYVTGNFVKWIIWNESSVMSFAALNRHMTILSKTNSYISYCYFIYILYTFNDTNRCITWYSIFVQTRYQQDFHKKMLARCCNTNILQPWLRNISILLFINYD